MYTIYTRSDKHIHECVSILSSRHRIYQVIEDAFRITHKDALNDVLKITLLFRLL